MDRKWMFTSRLSTEYKNGVEEFVNFAFEHADNPNRIKCPCIRCGCLDKVSVQVLKAHLFINGIDRSYTTWIWHGESAKEDNPINLEDSRGDEREADSNEGDKLEDMIHDVEENFMDRPHLFERLKSDAEKPLYVGCSKFTRLSAVLRLYNLKAGNGWSDKSFTALLELMKDMLPEDNELPDRTYDAKKILCSMGMNYDRIHACPNDCILYRKEYEDLEICPVCGVSRYKLNKNNSERKKGIPAKVLWYLPVIPRFKRMFGNAKHAKSLTWHSDGRIVDNMLRHPADSVQWTMIDDEFPDFGYDPRNLRLGLSTDGMNPHGNMSSTLSTWPVILTIYNLPPWLCMKRKFLMLSLLISGPKQPGNDIDIFLAPLIEDLKVMWEGVEVFDAHRQEFFKLRAMLLWTINDFPAYGNLSGYSVKGHKACPICEQDTFSLHLKHGRKIVYLGTRRFLPMSHRYRRLRKSFNGSKEEGRAPKALSAEQVYKRVENLIASYGKGKRNRVDKNVWKKRSIFYDLPYWRYLFVRHCLDVMHVEKNICDSIIGTLLNIPGKSKDGIKARMDYIEMGIREQLKPVQKGQNTTYLPPACHTLSRKEKSELCQCLAGIKVPSGYSSNIRSLVSMKDLKLVGLKSHDCHALMQQLLPVAIRSILPNHVRYAITRLCFFFNAICNKVIDPTKLDEMQKDIVVTLCQLEMYFPPSFFDIMVHLTVHLVREIKLCGPVYLRWMYPFERYMKILKGYVRNRYRPEGCIVECYIAEEAVEFCSEYLSDVEAIGLPKSLCSKIPNGTGTSTGLQVVEISNRDVWRQAHLYVLHNSDEVQPYIDKHVDHIRCMNPGRSKNMKWVTDEHNKSFIKWFQNRINEEVSKSADYVSETLRWLASGPSMEVLSYSGYSTNGYCFYTKAHDDKSTVQNSGVTLVAQAMHISSAKDKNPVFANMSYYGIIEDIWELDYIMFRVPVFRCKWVENNNGIKVDELGFILVDLNKEGHKEEPFILASQAKQVFYITDPADKKWSIVLSAKQKITNDGDDESDTGENIDDVPSFSLGLRRGDNVESDDEDGDGLYIRDDHYEGILVEDISKKRKK